MHKSTTLSFFSTTEIPSVNISSRKFILETFEVNFLFSNEKEKKPNGVIFFPEISDVFIDHGNKFKVPNRRIRIVITTSSRRLVLAAKSSELARVWVDAIVTGCEGNATAY
jgi:hypothetical protein